MIAALDFVYSQAPRTLRSVFLALWLFIVFLGNILNVAIVDNIENSAIEQIVFAALLLIATAIFVRLATRYEYAEAATAQPAPPKRSIVNLMPPSAPPTFAHVTEPARPDAY